MDLCSFCSAENAEPSALAPRSDTVNLCAICTAGLEGKPEDDPHWRCLNDAIWSPEQTTQVAAYRVLAKLEASWARDLLDISYLEPDLLEWAQSVEDTVSVVHKDSNGAVLAAGDTVVLIKDLPVKGAGFTAKRGTAVRNISLVADNSEHIEGRVEGQRIVILTKFIKKNA
ncbi:MAG: alkylphosphonate utilization protein [Paracoccaceae bacterium]|jgi:protein PhnA|nr:alkylphosphonate utilization protein [Paracoccaceae bacterium]